MNQSVSSEIATLAGGCFWCLDGAFSQIEGVDRVVAGYTGGSTINPSYEQVCSGTTGHAEAVQVTFNPTKISYRQILEIFFSVHDPTTLNRQGADIGTQYRSAIFYQNESQRTDAEGLIKELEKSRTWKNPIVTQLSKLDKFYPAEEYHQNYLENHPEAAYCRIVISPKIIKLRKRWADRLKSG